MGGQRPLTVVPLRDWAAFESEMSRMLEEFSQSQIAPEVTPPLFRGHSIEGWSLSTTLERFVNGAYSMMRYGELINKIAPVVVSLTGKAWRRGPPWSGFEQPPFS